MTAPREHTDAELAEALRTGTIRCLRCGEQRPVDCWCTCAPVEEQLAEERARIAKIEARGRGGDRDRFREQLLAGKWTDGARLQVRLS